MSHPDNRSSLNLMEDDSDLNVPFFEHLAMPGDENRPFLDSFKASFDAAYKKNPSKRARTEDVSPSHVGKHGYSINVNKTERHWEMTQATIFTTLDVLYTEMVKLQQQMAAISKAIADLSASIPSLINTQIEGVTKQLASFDPTQFPPLEASLEKVVKSAVKETIKHDTTDRLRKHQVFLRNLEPGESDSTSVEELCQKINADAPTKFFRLKGEKGIRPLILQFTTPEQAIKFIQKLSKSKRSTNPLFPSLIARPNYTVEEERTFKAAWAEACEKNDAAGQKQYIVRNLKVVKLDKPGEWTKRERPTRT